MSRNQTPLTEEEIEEELITSNLVSSGGVEDEDVLRGMNLNEKKDLLRGIEQSKEVFQDNQPSSPNMLDNLNFPSLPSASKASIRSLNRLSLPRKTSNNRSLSLDAEKVINLLDDDEAAKAKKEKFSLPGFVNDNAPALKMPNCQMMPLQNPYYCKDGEDPDKAMHRMINHHMIWRAEYMAEMKRLQSLEHSEELEMTEDDDVENNVYEFQSQSPKPKPPSIMRSASTSTSLTSRSQRRASPDSDCVEVEESILKTEDPQLGEWLTATNSRKSKRNCRSDKAKSQDKVLDVEFGFNKTWDSQSANWQDEQGSSSTLNNRRSLPRTPVVEEKKVECPICQRNFPQSKVENHAAQCEGYSDSPMDVEEGS